MAIEVGLALPVFACVNLTLKEKESGGLSYHALTANVLLELHPVPNFNTTLFLNVSFPSGVCF